MISITRPLVTMGDLVLGHQLTCQSCDRQIFILMKTQCSHSAYVNNFGWRMVETDDTVHECICPSCVNELEAIEQGVDE